MKFQQISIILACLMIACGTRAGVNPAVELSAHQFPPQDVQLLDGPFKDAMERDARYLLSLDPDRLLSGFRSEAGLKPKAPKYGGWESQGIAGHTLGHYLSACSRMYQDTGNPALLERVNYIVAQLAECQKANGNGYVAAIPNGKKVFAEVAHGELRVQDFNLDGGWVPWYTIHKEFAGLIDACRFCGSTQALEVATNLANWADATTGNLTEAQWQKMLICEQGGMNEAMANLYALTGNTNYLNLAEKFYHQAVMNPLARGDDMLNGLHSNMQIPKTIGAARLYELTGQPRYADIAKFFWNRVAQHRSYVIGGNGDSEHFFPINDFVHHLDAATCETCCTYNMLKLTLHLFEWSPSAREMDFYERALYNDILVSQDPDTGMFVYLMSLEPGGFKTYSTPHDSFWCCVGTGMENHSRYNQAIYFHGDDSLYVNLFIASELSWPEKEFEVRQDTKFPYKDTTRLTFQSKKPVKLALKVRWPAWAKTLGISINGKKFAASGEPSSYITIDREWHDGDVVNIHLPMSLHTVSLPGTTNLLAALYGPIVLAGELGTNGMPADSYAKDQTKFVKWPTVPVPVFVAADGSLLKHIQATRNPLTFRTRNLGRPQDVTLVPFYDVQHQRYNVYWQVLSKTEWKQQEARFKDKWRQESEQLAAWEKRAAAGGKDEK
jgi:uncharacterized protein